MNEYDDRDDVVDDGCEEDDAGDEHNDGGNSR